MSAKTGRNWTHLPGCGHIDPNCKTVYSGSIPDVASNYTSEITKIIYSRSVPSNRFATALLPLAFCSRFCMTDFSAASTIAAASSCMPGITWLYRSRVMPTLLCPRRSLATLG